MNIVCETERLVVREFKVADAAFIICLLNDSSFIQNIGDKNVRSHIDAIAYLKEGPMASYQGFGFGLNLVSLKHGMVPIGMCGLLKRNELEHPDLGYAFLPEFCAKGYAFEASKSVLNTTIEQNSLSAVLAITLPNNNRSNHLLDKLGFEFKRTIELYGASNNLYEYLL
ncbi:GNAT family N-acetyltransferase [Glaciecola sp. SC05]|uniref:GNAT family N-acetyltransferase n=1 Tax=Glaciecola sp. SC05 TaxID=1987355 RepID=UPI003526F8B1